MGRPFRATAVRAYHYLLYRHLLPRLYAGWKFTCPCCEARLRSFRRFRTRRNALCPKCGSLERHRLIALYLRYRTDFFSGARKTVLHIGPELCLVRMLGRLPQISYLSADLNDPAAMARIDITEIPLSDDSFDVILCSHVLEHVPDDRAAMCELLRVLRPGGLALLQSPIDLERAHTFEDPSVVTPEERARVFGQDDHVRIYGRDYEDRLCSAGFDVRIEPLPRELGDLARIYGLDPTEAVYCCRKPGETSLDVRARGSCDQAEYEAYKG